MNLVDLDGAMSARAVHRAVAERDSWNSPDLSLLGTGRRVAPPFPVELLDRFWSGWVTREAQNASAPADYVATPLLA